MAGDDGSCGVMDVRWSSGRSVHSSAGSDLSDQRSAGPKVARRGCGVDIENILGQITTIVLQPARIYIPYDGPSSLIV